MVCGNDVIAYGVLLEAERSGFSVPRDLSVVGFDDLDWSRHLRPSLTTIHVPTGETWQRAGEYLVRSLAGELRRMGGFAKDTTPFSEFLWADYLRRKLSRKAVDANFEKALEKALADGGPYVIAIEIAKGSEASPWAFIHPARNN